MFAYLAGAGVEGIAAALVFGSWAARHAGQRGVWPGDIDMLVLGDPDRDALHATVGKADQLGTRQVGESCFCCQPFSSRDLGCAGR